MERNVGLSLFLLLFLFLKSSLDCRVSLTSARRSKDPRRSHISPRSDCAEHRSPRSTERCRSHSESMRINLVKFVLFRYKFGDLIVLNDIKLFFLLMSVRV